jgi:hypothetical protein
MSPPTLDSLPQEILHEICFYVSPVLIHSTRRSLTSNHPLLALSRVNRTLHAATEGFSRHQLQKLRTRFNYLKPNVFGKAPYRLSYLRFVRDRCAFCGNKTVCTARVFNHIRCCRSCDNRKWPDKITLTYARTTYALKEDLLMSRCNWGSYMCHGVWTRMFLERQVKALAREVHGDLEKWMAEREKKRQVRKDKREEKYVTQTLRSMKRRLTGRPRRLALQAEIGFTLAERELIV